MKHTIALCLLLAASWTGSCSASASSVDFQPFLRLQQKAMRSLISSHAVSDDPDLINNCFNQYITEQQGVLLNYNKVYNGCVGTAQDAKSDLTAQSEELRKDLLSRSDGMCGSLYACDSLDDGLQFFDCYRNASADSYKVMFTLNNDANTQFNTISSKYSVIDSDMTKCVEEARMEYARDLEKCDSEFNVCIYGGEVSSKPEPQPEPTTVRPIESTTEQEPIVTSENPSEPDVTSEEPQPEPEVTTEEPEVTTERSPEEDLKVLPASFKGALDKLKRFY